MTPFRASLAVILTLSWLLSGPAGRSADEVPREHEMTIVLDPGHGGDDLGVVGQSGLTERDIALDVCRRLERIVKERLGTPRVVLTRSSAGQGLDAPARSSLANGKKGDVFVSVHVGASARPEESGPHVYVMSSSLRIVELSERRLHPRARRIIDGAAPAEADGELRLLPWAMAQQDAIPRSTALAERIARELPDAGGRASVSRLPLAALAGARMPAVLVEVGFLTNGADEERLESDRYKELLAQGLFRAIASLPFPARAQVEEPSAPEDGESQDERDSSHGADANQD